MKKNRSISRVASGPFASVKDVKESRPEELFDDLFEIPPSMAPQGSPPPATLSKHQWILRFALRVAQLDPRSQPKAVIGAARELWQTNGHLLPEDVAVATHHRDSKKR